MIAAGRAHLEHDVTRAWGIERAIAELDPDVVLVDYFDTVVTRAIPARAVKRVVARFVRERYGLACTIDGIGRVRSQAEEALRIAAAEAGYDPEHRIDEMAAEIWRRLAAGGERSLPGDPEELVDTFTEIELAVEALAQTVDRDVVDVLRRQAGRRRVVLVTDFHLPSPLVGRMLQERGVADLFEQVFVSCDPRLSKATGRLYDHVLGSLAGGGSALDPGRVLMIGDNPVSDVARATGRGLAAHQIVRPAPVPPSRLRRRLDRTVAGRRQAVRQAIGAAGRPRFAELAVTLYAFVRSLHDTAAGEGLDPLLFLSREGQYLKVLFDRYQQRSPAAAGRTVGSAYLVVSRRSTALAGLAPIDDETFDSILSRYPRLSLADLVGSLGFEPGVAAGVGRELGVAAGEPFDAGRLKEHPGFRQLYEQARQEQAELLSSYVEQVTGTVDGPLHVVDVGWKGTIQDHLHRALGDRRRIQGLYLGVVADRAVPNGEAKRGILFDSRRPPSAAFRTLRHFKSLYEFLLQADHGSAAGYARNGDGGRVVPVLDTQPTEVEVYERHVGPVQEAILAVFDELCRLDGLAPAPVIATLDEATWFHSRMLFFPRRSEVDLVRSLRHYENFGTMGFVDAAAGSDLTARQRLGALRALATDPRRILGAGWPPLALTALGLRPLIPALGAYRLVRERTPPAIRRLGKRLPLLRWRAGP
jgi:FMN phosphatase YigB (HAD superfamily)